MSQQPPTLWVDADAAPRAVKEVLFRVAERLQLSLILVANSAQHLPRSRFIRQIVVGKGLDVADDHIVEHCSAGDVVITADIPLAAQLVEVGALVITPRGEQLDEGNVRQRLAMRDLMEEMRASGLAGGGPPPFGPQDKARFANALDRLITARLRQG
jgi:uncharacterized protein YaiI (UPF0178 family)